MTNYHISPDNIKRKCVAPQRCAYGTQAAVVPMGKNGSYYGSVVSNKDIESIIDTWKQNVGDDYTQMVANREARDKTSDFHMTVINPREAAYLRKQGVDVDSVLSEEVNIIPEGVGKQTDENGNEAWFVIVNSPEADRQREKLGLPNKDLHVTLGFIGKDVHNVPKDISTDVGLFDSTEDSAPEEEQSSFKTFKVEKPEDEEEQSEPVFDKQHDTKVSLSDLNPKEFDVDDEGNVIIPDDYRESIRKEIADQYISESVSEDGKYVMLKYSKSAMYDQHWNETTINTRGVLTDREHRRVYARGFTKFFNVSEHEQRDGFEELPKDDKVVLAKKMDGSLGLITNVDGENRVYTSGSALVDNNEIAVEGRNILNEKLDEIGDTGWKPPKNITVLAEIISDVNPIVIDYGGQRKLVVLSAVDNRTGKTLSDDEVEKITEGFDRVEKINGGKAVSYQEAMTTPVPSGEEGYVLEFQNKNQNRAKIKGEEYVQAHRLLTNMSAKNLWENISSGQDDKVLENIKKTAPERAYQTVLQARDKMKSDAQSAYKEREKAVSKALSDYGVKSIDEVPKSEMGKFVGHLRGYGSGKPDFTIDIMIARGMEDRAMNSVLERMKPKGKVSVSSLVSAEESEVGDDADDNL